MSLGVEDVEIGDPSPAVYMHLESEFSGPPVAVFVSRFGDTFGLERYQVSLRIRYLASQGMDCGEEHRALEDLAVVGG